MSQDNLFAEYKDIFKESEGVSLEKEEGKVFGYSPFALQDAVGERDMKKMWLEYEKLRFSGVEADDLVHKIVAKVRHMTAISKGASKEDLEVKDYPFNKSKRDLKNWKEKDLENFYTKLIEIYHQSRMGGDELDLAIEKTFLHIFNTGAL